MHKCHSLDWYIEKTKRTMAMTVTIKSMADDVKSFLNKINTFYKYHCLQPTNLVEPLEVSFCYDSSLTISMTELACFHAKRQFSGARIAMSEAEVLLISCYVFFCLFCVCVFFFLNGQTQRGRLRARKSKKSQTHFDPR